MEGLEPIDTLEYIMDCLLAFGLSLPDIQFAIGLLKRFDTSSPEALIGAVKATVNGPFEIPEDIESALIWMGHTLEDLHCTEQGTSCLIAFYASQFW
jgi:hypothetical protein